MLRSAVAIIFSLSSIIPAAAATLTPEVERKSGDWAAVLYRNAGSDRLFCALESYDGKTVFRINSYKDTNGTFLEILNDDWNLLAAQTKFSLRISIKGENYSAEFTGLREKNAYIYDFTDNDTYLSLLGMISKATSVDVLNPNGANIATFGGRQSDVALDSYGDCLNNDWLQKPKSAVVEQAVPSPIYRFDQYPVLVPAKKKPVKLPDFRGREKDFTTYRTRIQEGMRKGPDLAGHYSVVVIGCGTGCVFAVVGDNQTGRVIPFPRGGDDNMYLDLKYQLDSSLVQAQWSDPAQEGACKREYFQFDGMKFDLLGTSVVGTQDDCLKSLQP